MLIETQLNRETQLKEIYLNTCRLLEIKPNSYLTKNSSIFTHKTVNLSRVYLGE